MLGWVGHAGGLPQGTRFAALLTVGGRIFYETHCIPLLLGGQGVEQIALEIRRADGTAMPVLFGAKVHSRGGDGTPDIVRVTMVDVSQRRLFMQDLVARNDELLSSNEVYDAFAHAVAHDLQAPLRAIRLNTEFFLEDTEGLLPAGSQDQLRTVMRLTDRMKRMLRDLLTYAQVGRGEWNPERLALAPAVAEVVDLLGSLTEQATVTAPHDATFTADPAALRQLLLNLIGNAAKYSGGGPATIAVGLTTLREAAALGPLPAVLHAAAPDTPVLFVRDRGVGIDPAHHAHIFALFRQLDSDAEGSGAGLALCRLICRRHGGDVWLTSTPGEGTTFFVVIGS